jgi:hypothetical protein
VHVAVGGVIVVDGCDKLNRASKLFLQLTDGFAGNVV